MSLLKLVVLDPSNDSIGQLKVAGLLKTVRQRGLQIAHADLRLIHNKAGRGLL